MANISDDPGHGSSPAAWTAVTIMLIGVAIGTVALFLNVLFLVFVGAALVPVGLIVGGVMKKAGYGVGGSHVGSHH
ncbi:HGxxPAAW family protein [Amnibacterium endophyticum]|uniref:HGxxPAAW family protein n=1 Tax=Amnibacterium endophyticum TaxID=2109337 RepID=A0ABW4LBR7_9MICO